MDSPSQPPPIPPPGPPASPERTGLPPAFVPLGVLGVLLLKFKALLLLALKFLPVLVKTWGTRVLSVVGYAQAWGWGSARGFVLLSGVQECGHLPPARRRG